MNSLRLVWNNKLTGRLIPAVPVPRDINGQIDQAAQSVYINYMNEQPIGGVAVWAHTGRGLHLTAKQRSMILRDWRNGLDEDKFIVAGAGAPKGAGDVQKSINSAKQMALQAKDLGAEMVLAYPPSFLLDEDEKENWIVEYHVALASIGLPVLAFYLYEAAGGINYSLSTLKRLFAIENIVAIKMATLDSVMTFQDVSKLIEQEFPDVALITGEDRMLGYTLMRGAKCALIGMGAACPGPQARLIDAYLGGRSEEFLSLSNEIDAFAETTFIAPMEGYIQRMLWALLVLGIIPTSATYDPIGPPISDYEKEQVMIAVKRLDDLPNLPVVENGVDREGI